jgi:hypothetical protein
LHVELVGNQTYLRSESFPEGQHLGRKIMEYESRSQLRTQQHRDQIAVSCDENEGERVQNVACDCLALRKRYEHMFLICIHEHLNS